MMLYAACIMSFIHLIFFNYLDLQVVKINLFYKIILVKTRFIMLLEMADRSIQPDGIAKIHIITKLFKTVENLVCAGVFTVITYHFVLKHMVVFPNFSP